MLVGKYLGAEPLGFYGLAYNFMLFPLQAVAQTLGRVLFPAFAAMQGDHARLRQAYLRSSAAIAFFAFPLMTGVTILAPEVIALFLGPRWGPAVPVLRNFGAYWYVAVPDNDHGADLYGYGSDAAMFRGVRCFPLCRRGLRGRFALGIVGVAAIYAMLSVLLMISQPRHTVPLDWSAADRAMEINPAHHGDYGGYGCGRRSTAVGSGVPNQGAAGSRLLDLLCYGRGLLFSVHVLSAV